MAQTFGYGLAIITITPQPPSSNKSSYTHVANPARISVKNREFFLSFGAPENSNLNHLPKALCATLRLNRSAHVMLAGR